MSFTKADGDTKDLAKNLRKVAEEMMDMLDPSVSVLAKGNLDMSQMSVSLLADLLAAHSGIEVGTAQQVLETSDLKARVEMVIEAVAKVREVMKLSNEISNSVKSEMSKSQREFLLRQQMKAIEKELGETGGGEDGEDELGTKTCYLLLAACRVPTVNWSSETCSSNTTLRCRGAQEETGREDGIHAGRGEDLLPARVEAAGAYPTVLNGAQHAALMARVDG